MEKKRPKVSRREFMRQGVFGAGITGLMGMGAFGRGLFADSAPRRPNIVFIITDDQAASTIGCYGGKVLTPHIDSLARDGIKFDRAYTSSPMCVPTRYTCNTGRYAGWNRGREFAADFPPGTQSRVLNNTALEADATTLAQVLGRAGYATGMVGKWHLDGRSTDTHAEIAKLFKVMSEKGADAFAASEKLAQLQKQVAERLKTRGFDYAASIYDGNPGDMGHHQEWVTRGGLDFIAANKDKPFYLYFSTTLLHRPFTDLTLDECLTPGGRLERPLDVQPPRATIVERMKEAGIAASNRDAVGATWLDDGVGAILKKLDQLGIADNTVVVYFSDQQAGGKATLYENGVRVPLLIRWKSRVKGGSVCGRLVQNIDFVPTFLEIAGVTAPEDMPLDGKSFLPLLTGETAVQWRDALFCEMGYGRAAVTEKWKYIAIRYPEDLCKREGFTPPLKGTHREHFNGKRYNNSTMPWGQARADMQKTIEPDQLYDLKHDPREEKNLIGDPQYAAVLKELKGCLAAWLERFGRPFGEFVPAGKITGP